LPPLTLTADHVQGRFVPPVTTTARLNEPAPASAVVEAFVVRELASVFVAVT